jgi:dihydrolipoamide dehydrogenase
MFQRLGSEVTVLEILPQILPGSDPEITRRLERLLKAQGIKIFTSMKIEESYIQEDKIQVKGVNLKNHEPFEYKADKVLVAAGRRPVFEVLKEKDTAINLDQDGFVAVNSQLETDMPGVYAIGDLIGKRLLAHKASHEGILAAENAYGAKKTLNYNAIPLAVFTEPEFSCVGLTEPEAREVFAGVKVGIFSLQANGRALTMGTQEGMVKVVADKQEKILGAHILAPNASEIIPELALAIRKGMKLHDIAATVHIHPTLSEAVMEAAMKARGEAIHVLNI